MLTLDNVRDFAVEQFSRTIGLNYPEPVFLVGGAFKTILHEKAPRDMDFFVPGDENRTKLISHLIKRGAKHDHSRPFGDLFTMDNLKIDVPLKTSPFTLEERLARCDLGLSAIGAEMIAGNVRSLISPWAWYSARRRKIFIIKPLVNKDYCLSTLSRAMRYADELEWAVPAEDEDFVWRFFQSLRLEGKIKAVERYRKSVLVNPQILRKAKCLCHR